jgi:hypothetical protein
MVAMPALGRQKQEDCKLKASLSYIARLSQGPTPKTIYQIIPLKLGNFGWEFGSMVELLPTMHEALCLIPLTEKKKQLLS